jgi:D-alanyl-D-alanine carboxypeptidase (penicillin-binding protein 5/6)
MKDSQYLKKKPRKFKNINKNPRHGHLQPGSTHTKIARPISATTIEDKQTNVFKNVLQNLRTKIKLPKTHFLTNFKKYELDFILVLIPLIIFVILLIIHNMNQQLIQQIEKNQLYPLDYTVKLSPYPFLGRFIVPDISAPAAIIADADSQTVLYSKNPDLRFSLASTTKIMTALVALDYYQENSILTIYSPIIEGSYLGVYLGEQFYFKDLLFAMLLPSSNEAAYAVAQNYPGGIDAFIRKMNEKAQELNLTNTHYADPAGLDDDNDYSTVLDMSRLASFATKNKTLASIFATRQKIISDVTGQRQFQLENLNKLLGIDGVNGVKTGTTEGAGEVLVTSKVENGHTFIIIVMKSKQRFVDTKTLLSLISNNIRYLTPEAPGFK